MTFSLTGTSAPCVVKVGKIAEIWGNMWRIFTFLVPLTTSASIALRIFQQGTVWIFIFPKIASRNRYLRFFHWLMVTWQGSDNQLYDYIVKDGPVLHRCSLCGKSSSDRSNLRKHVDYIHFPGAFSYSCKYCSETFTPQETCWTCTFQNSIEIYNSWLQVETSSFTIT